MSNYKIELVYYTIIVVKIQIFFSVSLMKGKSPLEYFMIRNSEKNIEKHPPTNENITLFKHLDVSFMLNSYTILVYKI